MRTLTIGTAGHKLAPYALLISSCLVVEHFWISVSHRFAVCGWRKLSNHSVAQDDTDARLHLAPANGCTSDSA
eukprot:6184670-Pleurochrysis_carterae.AAC.1